MSRLEHILFNLLVNGTFSFLAGCLVVFITVKLFRIGETRWKLYFLSLPFVKILWDLFRGIPADSYLYHGLNPLALLPKHTTLAIGAGLSEYGPTLRAVLSVADAKNREFSISLADYLAEWLRQRLAAGAPEVLLVFLGTVATVLLFRRLFLALKFERARRADRTSPASRRLDSIALGPREVDVYVSESYSGTPFTGGLIKPYICIPKSTLEALDEPERKAVLEHELAHAKYFDLPINLAVQSLGDLFWFVPGYRWLSRKIDRLREILADQAAIARGASPAALASALVKLKTHELSVGTPILYSAFVKERSLLKTRVKCLLDGEQEKPRLGWNHRWLRFLLGAWATGAVMLCTLGGNHEVEQVPEWVDKLLRALGIL